MVFTFPTNVLAQAKRKVKRHHVKNRRRKHIKVRRQAHYRYRHLPHRGKVVTSVGRGYVNIKIRGVGFRFHKGVWYKPKGNRFVVVPAPFGARVNILPVGYKKLVIRSRPYYYYFGTYYIKAKGIDEYLVVEGPVGAEVNALPEGYTIVTIADTEYYKLDETFYEPRLNGEDEEYFVIVKNPAI